MSAVASNTPNPAWVERLLSAHWQGLVDLVGEDMMPLHEQFKAPRSSAPLRVPTFELGCGHYGCVMATGTDDIVCKVTSDPSEAAFVAAYMAIGKQPLGIVRYHGLVELPARHRSRRTFVIWRQEADRVGLIFDLYAHAGIASFEEAAMHYVDRYGRGWLGKFAFDVQQFRDIASIVRESMKRAKDPAQLIADATTLKKWANQQGWPRLSYDKVKPRLPGWMTRAQRVAMAIAMLETLAEGMENTAASSLIGEAFGFYLERGILLADVHLGNVGEVTPEDYSTWELVITDPGHMVPLDTRWLGVKVPQLYG